jgi:cytochrome c biogenesis protein CcmG, thiol:disulfide interchange protein DsbE
MALPTDPEFPNVSDSPQVTASPPSPAPSYRHLIWAGLFMLIGLSFLIFLGRERGRIVGQPLVDVDLQPLLYVEKELSRKDWNGRFVLLHFWGPWCGPCRVEYPEIAKLQRSVRDHPEVRIVSVSCGSSYPEDLSQLKTDTQNMVGSDGEGQAVYCDPAEFSRIQVARLLGQRGFAYPTTLLLDRQGRIVEYWLGATSPGEIERALTKELSKQKAPVNPRGGA